MKLTDIDKVVALSKKLEDIIEFRNSFCRVGIRGVVKRSSNTVETFDEIFDDNDRDNVEKILLESISNKIGLIQQELIDMGVEL